MARWCLLFLLATAAVLFAGPALAYDGERTFDMLTPEENAELTKLEDRCFSGVRDDALKLLTARVDRHTILRTFPERVRIVRQRKRPLFLDVERYLYSLRLNSEFIHAYVRDLKDDTVLRTLDVLVSRAHTGDR